MSRKRSRLLENQTFRCFETNNINNNVENKGLHDVRVITETMVDVITPNFKKVRESGSVVVNPLSYVHHRSTEPVTTWTMKTSVGNRIYTVTGNYTQEITQRYKSGIPPVTLEGLDIDSMVSTAKFRALGFMDSTQYSFGEAIAELRATSIFLSRKAYEIKKLCELWHQKRKVLNRLKDLNKKEYSRAFATAWAQTFWALLPLVRTSQEAIAAFLDTFEKSYPKRSTARGFVEDTQSGSATKTGAGSGWTFKVHNTVTQKVKVHAGVIYRNNSKHTLLTSLGLRNRDLMITVWEVYPASFMIDRLYNIKGFLKGVRNLSNPQLDILGGFVVIRKETQSVSNLTDLKASGQALASPDYSPPWTQTTFEMSRSAWQPTFLDSVPQLTPENLVKDIKSTIDLITISILKLS